MARANSALGVKMLSKIDVGTAMGLPLKTSLVISVLMSLLFSGSAADAQAKGLLVRIAEVEIDSRYLKEYCALLKEEAEASVRLEPGVISIFPSSILRWISAFVNIISFRHRCYKVPGSIISIKIR